MKITPNQVLEEQYARELTFSFFPQSTLQFLLRSTPLPGDGQNFSKSENRQTNYRLYTTSVYILNNHFFSHKGPLPQQVCDHSDFPLEPPIKYKAKSFQVLRKAFYLSFKRKKQTCWIIGGNCCWLPSFKENKRKTNFLTLAWVH